MSKKTTAELAIDRVIREWLEHSSCGCIVKIEHTTSKLAVRNGDRPVDVVRIYHDVGCDALEPALCMSVGPRVGDSAPRCKLPLGHTANGVMRCEPGPDDGWPEGTSW